jgi:hypothetical protein
MNRPFTLKRFLTSIFVLAMMAISTSSLTNNGGPPGGYTNAPGENNCRSCHSGTSLQTTGTHYNNVSLTSNFTGNGYIPDSVYTIELKYVQSGVSKFGFQITCLNDNNAMAGSFTNTTSKTSGISKTVSGATRNYLRHTSSGTSGSGSITWSFQWTAPSSNIDTVTFYAVVNSANGNGQQSGDMIIAREFKIGPSSLLPVATAAAVDSSPCQYTAAGLLGSATNNPTSWSWIMPGGSPSGSSSQNPNVTFNTSGAKYAVLVAKNAKGSSKPDTVDLNVLPGPSSFIFGNATRTICEGDSVKIEVAAQSGNSYLWSNNKTGTSIYASDTGVYYVDATGPNGCAKRSNAVTVKFHPKPAVTLTSDASQYGDSSCNNSVIELQASSSSTIDTFFFYNGSTQIDKTIQNYTSTVFDTTSVYSVIAQDDNGCLSDETFYTVKGSERLEAPVVSCSNQTSTSVRFEWDGSLYQDGFQVSSNAGVSWSNPSSGLTGNFHDLTNVQPDDTFELWVRALDQAPCFASATAVQECITDTCSPLISTVQYDSEVCFGDILNVEVNGLSGDFYGLSLDGGGSFTDTIFSFNPNVSQTYVISVIDSNHLACPAFELEMPITVDRIYDIDLKADKIGSYCEGETVTYTANDTIETYSFVLNGDVVQSGADNTYSNTGLSNNDSIYVIVTKGVCTDTSEVDLVSIEAPANASFSYSRVGSVYSFTPSIGTFSTYSWDFGDGSAMSNDVTPDHDFAAKEGETVSVTLEVTTDNNCVTDSVEVIALPEFSAVDELSNLGIKIYPNPFKDVLVIQNKDGRSGIIEIYGLSGNLITSSELLGMQNTIDLSDVESGIYLLKTTINNKVRTIKIYKH